ncbi:hypothetical protein VAEKB19_3970002 [Vibrio aestuarianus]|nr:hypothetical protein VAEKB19_3970002 [Vibrio aestuarianus]
MLCKLLFFRSIRARFTPVLIDMGCNIYNLLSLLAFPLEFRHHN